MTGRELAFFPIVQTEMGLLLLFAFSRFLVIEPSTWLRAREYVIPPPQCLGIPSRISLTHVIIIQLVVLPPPRRHLQSITFPSHFTFLSPTNTFSLPLTVYLLPRSPSSTLTPPLLVTFHYKPFTPSHHNCTSLTPLFRWKRWQRPR